MYQSRVRMKDKFKLRAFQLLTLLCIDDPCTTYTMCTMYKSMYKNFGGPFYNIMKNF